MNSPALHIGFVASQDDVLLRRLAAAHVETLTAALRSVTSRSGRWRAIQRPAAAAEAPKRGVASTSLPRPASPPSARPTACRAPARPAAPASRGLGMALKAAVIAVAVVLSAVLCTQF